MTNPPFGGEEERGILSNFPEDMQTAETSLLFLQLIMRKLKRHLGEKRGGRCGLVVPNGLLFGDGVAARVKERLLRNFNLHTIVRLPKGVFAPYTSIDTNVMFFEQGEPTNEIWYYQLSPPEGRKQYTKTNPVKFEDFEPVLAWWEHRNQNENAWSVPLSEIIKNNYNLDRKNPNLAELRDLREPEEVIKSFIETELKILNTLKEIQIEITDGENTTKF